MLIINTAAPDKITIILAEGKVPEAKAEIKTAYAHVQAEKLLPAIDQLLKKSKKGLGDLSGIAAVVGPGSFSSLRIGAIAANTLAFARKIPVAGVKLAEFGTAEELIAVAGQKLSHAKPGGFISPFYGQEPNITKPKKRKDIKI